MTMLRLTARQRSVVTETLRELANLVAGALILGQFIGQQLISPWLMVAGGAVWVWLFALALLFAKGNND